MGAYSVIVDHILECLKDDINPTAFIETKFVVDECETGATISSYGEDLSEGFKKYIGSEGILWVKYESRKEGTLEVIFSCNYDTDMNKFSKNVEMAKLMSSKTLIFDIDDILKMMSVEIHNVDGEFDQSLAEVLCAAAVLVVS